MDAFPVMNTVIVFFSVLAFALALNFYFFSKRPVSKIIAISMALGLGVLLWIIKLQLNKNNADFGGLFGYSILFYFIVKKKVKLQANRDTSQ
jgi:hypothetical protein